MPRSVRAKARAIEKAYAKLEAQLLRTPSDLEVATELGMTEDELQAQFSQISFVGIVALDEVLSGGDRGESTTLGDTLADRHDGPMAAFEIEEDVYKRQLARSRSPRPPPGSGGRQLQRSSTSIDLPSVMPVPDGSSPMTPVKRVDAHQHFWDLNVRDQPWTDGLPLLRRSFGLADLRPHLVDNRIDLTVVVQTICVAEETPELLAFAAKEPSIGGVVGWVDLCTPGVEDRIACLRELPGGDRLVGTRHQVQEETDPRWLCRPDVRRGLEAVAAAGLVYDIVVRHHQLPAVIETATALEEVPFVLDHAGKPPIASGAISPWREHVSSLARLPNVAVKLSGMVTEADRDGWTVEQLGPYGDVVLEAFGACLLYTSPGGSGCVR